MPSWAWVYWCSCHSSTKRWAWASLLVQSKRVTCKVRGLWPVGYIIKTDTKKGAKWSLAWAGFSRWRNLGARSPLHAYLKYLWHVCTMEKLDLEYLPCRRQTSCNNQQQGENDGTSEFDSPFLPQGLFRVEGNRGEGEMGQRHTKASLSILRQKQQGRGEKHTSPLLFPPRVTSLTCKRRTFPWLMLL